MLLLFLQFKTKLENSQTQNHRYILFINIKTKIYILILTEKESADMEIKFNVQFYFWAAVCIYNIKI